MVRLGLRRFGIRLVTLPVRFPPPLVSIAYRWEERKEALREREGAISALNISPVNVTWPS
jgi:hypothetical protein